MNLELLKNNSIYIHIPFCKQACHYCNFHFSTNLSEKNELVKCLEKEIGLRKFFFEDNSHQTINSIYFGGGTPSILDIEDIKHLVTKISKTFTVSKDLEVTIEVNPDDVQKKKLSELKKIGFNRLSIGIQSFNDIILKYINRVHDKAKALKTYFLARELGFQNINIDLIYGIPTSNLKIWQEDLKIAMEINPDHISTYCLGIEKNTYFGNLLIRGRFKEISEDEKVTLYNYHMKFLYDKGYDHYEISNFCKSAKYSKHNMNYWKKGFYVGIGPSAHSYNGKSRIWNISNNRLYIKKLNKNILPNTIEHLSRENHINEYIMTSLRTKWGCSIKYLQETQGYDLLHDNDNLLKSLQNLGFIKINDNSIITLTDKGKLLADKIASDFFIDEPKVN